MKHDGDAPLTPPAAPSGAAAVFGDRMPLAVRFTQILADTGVSHGLIGPREVPRLWERHVVNCAVIEDSFPEGASLVDVGSGAGLPGIALAIARPDLRVHLVEPMLRRTTWLEGVVSELELEGVVVHRGRAEDLAGAVRAPWVTARAVARLDKLCRWCVPLLDDGGTLVAMKGRSAREELEEDRPALERLGLTSAAVSEHGLSILAEAGTHRRSPLHRCRLPGWGTSSVSGVTTLTRWPQEPPGSRGRPGLSRRGRSLWSRVGHAGRWRGAGRGRAERRLAVGRRADRRRRPQDRPPGGAAGAARPLFHVKRHPPTDGPCPTSPAGGLPTGRAGPTPGGPAHPRAARAPGPRLMPFHVKRSGPGVGGRRWTTEPSAGVSRVDRVTAWRATRMWCPHRAVSGADRGEPARPSGPVTVCPAAGQPDRGALPGHRGLRTPYPEGVDRATRGEDSGVGWPSPSSTGYPPHGSERVQSRRTANSPYSRTPFHVKRHRRVRCAACRPQVVHRRQPFGVSAPRAVGWGRSSPRRYR